MTNPVSADQPTDEERTTQTVNTLLQSTVKVEPELLAAGTGFYVARNTVLTNYHVIEKSNYWLRITTYDGRSCKATLGYREEKPDLAILHTDCDAPALPITASYKLGQSIITLGNPVTFDFTLAKGIVSATRWGMIQYDAKVEHGSSGGPLANLSGQVVGVVTAKASTNDFMGFAVSGADTIQFLKRSGVWNN
jgi:S1-C subfamily serine protease